MNPSFEQFLLEHGLMGQLGNPNPQPNVMPNVHPAVYLNLLGLMGPQTLSQGGESLSQGGESLSQGKQPIAQGQQKEGVDTYSFKTGDGKTKISTTDPDALKSMAGVLGQYPIPEYKPTPMPEKFKPKVGSPLQSLLTALAFIAAPKATVEAMGGYLAGMEKLDKDKMERWQMESEMADRARQAAIQNRQMGIQGQEAMQNAALVGPQLVSAKANAYMDEIRAKSLEGDLALDREAKKQGITAQELYIKSLQIALDKEEAQRPYFKKYAELACKQLELTIENLVQDGKRIALELEILGKDAQDPSKYQQTLALLAKEQENRIALARVQQQQAIVLENLRSSNTIREIGARAKADIATGTALAKIRGEGGGYGGRGSGTIGEDLSDILGIGIPSKTVKALKDNGIAYIGPVPLLQKTWKYWEDQGVLVYPKVKKGVAGEEVSDYTKVPTINMNHPRTPQMLADQRLLNLMGMGYSFEDLLKSKQPDVMRLISMAAGDQRAQGIQNYRNIDNEYFKSRPAPSAKNGTSSTVRSNTVKASSVGLPSQQWSGIMKDSNSNRNIEEEIAKSDWKTMKELYGITPHQLVAATRVYNKNVLTVKPTMFYDEYRKFIKKNINSRRFKNKQDFLEKMRSELATIIPNTNKNIHDLLTPAQRVAIIRMYDNDGTKKPVVRLPYNTPGKITP